MKLTINGTEREFTNGLTGAELLAELNITPAVVVAELNRAIIPREEFLGIELKDGDSLELVTVVGGG